LRAIQHWKKILLEKNLALGVPMLAHAVLTITTQSLQGRRLFNDARICVEEAGDLDGLAQSDYEGAPGSGASEADLAQLRRALSTAQSTGNIEQQILAGALLSRTLLEIGDDEDAYNAFSRSMQIADQNGLKFMTARLLNERAQYYFDKGDFLQAGNFGDLAVIVSRSAGMSRTFAACLIRNARLVLRMGLPGLARESLAQAREPLRQFPNAALAAQITELENLAKQTRGRPELR
jgi:tetratricopeptide (TPR) repeat protein